MDLLETIKTNYSSIADALIKEQTETKGIVANMTSEMFAAEPVVITSEQLISGSDLKEIEAFSRKKNCVYIITLENENCISEIKTTFELKEAIVSNDSNFGSINSSFVKGLLLYTK